jgi:hypothetical protein
MPGPNDPNSFFTSVTSAGPGNPQPTLPPAPLGGPPQPTQGIPQPGTAVVPFQPPVVRMAGIQATPLHVMMDEERKKSEQTQAQPIIAPLAGFVRQCFQDALQAKRMTVFDRMLRSVRARRGEYDPQKLQAIRELGGSEIFTNLTSVKCRAAASWVRDVMMGQGEERPWKIEPTPVAEVPEDVGEIITNAVKKQILDAWGQGGDMDDASVLQATLAARDAAMAEVQEMAHAAAARMADLMEDQLIEGGYYEAMDAFIDDLTTFPTACLKGPIVRRKPVLKWVKGADGKYTPQTSIELKLGWERVSPFKIFPSPSATTVDDGYMIEQQTLSRGDLNQLIGVEGYDDASIRMVLQDYGNGGLRDWMSGLAEITDAEGKSTVNLMKNPDGLIDALQFWGSVPGQWLIDWGMDPKQVPEPTKEYHVEAWLIGSYIIKAVVNYDPLNRKPYFKASFEDVPGSWWGNSVCDLVDDDQQVVNAAARALINNVGLASGPQVVVNISRLAAGEKITQLKPWKIWQVVDDPQSPGSNASDPPVRFDQPDSNAQELVGIIEKFTDLADEHSGVPKYLSGGTTGGAGRTASGLSMLINNAGKAIKQVISSVDIGVTEPMLRQLYTHNMLYADDPALKGDVNIRATGANALLIKETVQQRRTEFLAATANPTDMQIVGVLGRAAILREIAKDLGMDVNDVVPSPEVLKAKFAAQQQMLAQQQPGVPGPGAPAENPTTNKQTLQDGSPITDTHSPTPQAPGAQGAARAAA